VAADVGQTIKVQVSRAGNSGTITSASTSSISAAGPVFTLTNIDTTIQSEGSDGCVFGLFPKGTANMTVIEDSKKYYSNMQPSAVQAYVGGTFATLPWQGGPLGVGDISISSTLTSASDHVSIWNGSGEYDGWIVVYNSGGTAWIGYKLGIDVQGNITRSVQDFAKVTF
jgi:hypothetical protein